MTASSQTLDIRFDAKGLIAKAGLVLPAALALRLGLAESGEVVHSRLTGRQGQLGRGSQLLAQGLGPRSAGMGGPGGAAGQTLASTPRRWWRPAMLIELASRSQSACKEPSEADRGHPRGGLAAHSLR